MGNRDYWGKYRGKVLITADPLGLGRIKAQVPGISDTALGWALPCVPVSVLGDPVRHVPRIGTHVWIEFEGGDPDYPIWTGCFWTSDQPPA